MTQCRVFFQTATLAYATSSCGVRVCVYRNVSLTSWLVLFQHTTPLSSAVQRTCFCGAADGDITSMSHHLYTSTGEKPSSAECGNEEMELGILAERDSRRI